MIFVTVGAQMPFDRLVVAVDEWAGRTGRTDVLAQIGESSYEPRHVRFERFLPPEEFEKAMAEAEVVVGHAGTGTLLIALTHLTPVLLMPRRAALKETRNDHQLATVRQFGSLGGVHVAMDEAELAERLDRLDEVRAGPPIAAGASPELIRAVREFILEAP